MSCFSLTESLSCVMQARYAIDVCVSCGNAIAFIKRYELNLLASPLLQTSTALKRTFFADGSVRPARLRRGSGHARVFFSNGA